MSPEVHNFADSMRKTLRQYMNDLTDSVALGNAKNFEEYQTEIDFSDILFGIISGIKLGIDILA